MMGILKLILAVVVVVIIVATIYANSLVSAALESAGSQALGVDVNVDFVSINAFAGTASISKIAIANPAGYAEKNAVELGGFSAEVSLASLLSDVVQIKELRIDQPVIMLEQKNGMNNLMALYSHMSAANSGSGEVQKKLIIDNLYINGGAVRLVAPQFKNAISPLSAKIDDIHLRGIGKDTNGATIGQVARILLKEISDKARQIDMTKFGTGAMRQIGGQLGVDADQLIKGREAEVDQLRGLLGGR